MPGQTEGREDRSDGQTLFYRTLPATTVSPTIADILMTIMKDVCVCVMEGGGRGGGGDHYIERKEGSLAEGRNKHPLYNK